MRSDVRNSFLQNATHNGDSPMESHVLLESMMVGWILISQNINK